MPASLVRVYIHYVWGTWKREPFLTDQIREVVFNVIGAKCQEQKVQLLALNGVEDHVHLLIAMPASASIAKLIADVKGSSSHAVTHLWPETPFKWQNSYGAFSVSESVLPTVQRYIANQQAHHTMATCQEGSRLSDDQ